METPAEASSPLPPQDPQPEAVRSDTYHPQAPQPEPVRSDASYPTTPRARRDALPWLSVVGFVLLAGAIAYVWTHPAPDPQAVEQAQNAANEAQTNTGAINGLNQRLSDGSQRLNDLEGKLNALDQRAAAVGPGDVAKLSARLDALDGRLTDQSQLSSRVDTVSGRIEALSARDQTASDETKRQIDGLAAALKTEVGNLSNRLQTLENASGHLSEVSKRLDHVARLQEATFALSVGRPLGDLPGAPAALTRFAQNAPPTEAQLRLSFIHAKQQALAKAQPDNASAPFIDRVLEKAQGLVTVRQGNDVVVGDASGIALGHAQSALDIGDLQGAVQAVQTLKGQPAEAMTGWLADAQSLLGARTALAQMADQA